MTLHPIVAQMSPSPEQKPAVLARGLEGIFSPMELEARLRSRSKVAVTPRQREMASRILYAYEVDGRCPCDDTVCEFGPP